MKIAVFWKKYNGSHHKEIRRIYSFIFYALSELGYDFDVLDQDYYQNRGLIVRADREAFLPTDSWTHAITSAKVKKKWPWVKSVTSLPLPNMPFCGKHFLEGYDISIMFHTIGTCKKTIHVKPSYYPGFFYFDLAGYSAWSGWSKDHDFTKVSLRMEWLSDLLNKTKYEQTATKSSQTTRPYVFVPLQVTTDSVANLAQQSSLQFLKIVVEMAEIMPYDFVFKVHPKCNCKELKDTLDKVCQNEGLYISDGPVLDLITASKAVFVVNSGVGFESLLHAKPIVTFGESDYAFLTCKYHKNKNIDSIVNYIEKFTIDEGKKNQEVALKMISRNFVRIGDIGQLHLILKQRIGSAYA